MSTNNLRGGSWINGQRPQQQYGGAMVCDVKPETEHKSSKVMRGGSFVNDKIIARAACRADTRPLATRYSRGFRIVCDVEPDPDPEKFEFFSRRQKTNAIRGGSWRLIYLPPTCRYFDFLRSSQRLVSTPHEIDSSIGFRVVCDPLD